MRFLLSLVSPENRLVREWKVVDSNIETENLIWAFDDDSVTIFGNPLLRYSWSLNTKHDQLKIAGIAPTGNSLSITYSVRKLTKKELHLAGSGPGYIHLNAQK
jgi:hypothetical protein